MRIQSLTSASARFRHRYLILAAIVFTALVAIEVTLDGGFVRNSVGDALVVILVYAVVMTFSTWSQITAAIVSLAIAYAVETSQALDLVDRLGLTPSRLTDVVLGSTFTWTDIAAYTVGILAILTAEALSVSEVGMEGSRRRTPK